MPLKKGTALARLQALVPPPAAPGAASAEERREEVERQLGTPLPDDLYSLARTYGSGSFAAPDNSCVLRIHNPFIGRFVGVVHDWARTLRDIKAAEGEAHFPYGIHPERPGLLKIGGDDNGRLVFWLTDGEPTSWPILVWPLERQFIRIHLPLNEFIVRLLAGEIDVWGGGMNAAWFKNRRQELTFRSTPPSTSDAGAVQSLPVKRAGRKKSSS